MQDKSLSIPLYPAMSYLVWLAMVVLLTLGTWLNSFELIGWGLGASAFAATLSIRCFVSGLSRTIHDRQAAFDLGRDTVRAIR
tara:strand:- start:173 stop:421 length:249 start_codon:yes stop_codon:yes gene_type:complete